MVDTCQGTNEYGVYTEVRRAGFPSQANAYVLPAKCVYYQPMNHSKIVEKPIYLFHKINFISILGKFSLIYKFLGTNYLGLFPFILESPEDCNKDLHSHPTCTSSETGPPFFSCRAILEKG